MDKYEVKNGLKKHNDNGLFKGQHIFTEKRSLNPNTNSNPGPTLSTPTLHPMTKIGIGPIHTALHQSPSPNPTVGGH